MYFQNFLIDKSLYILSCKDSFEKLVPNERR